MTTAPDTVAAARRVAKKYGNDPDVRALLAEVSEDEPVDKARRDALICEAAATLWPNSKPATAAGHLCRALRRYGASSWRRDDAPPSDPRAAILWRILRAGPVILSERSTRRILAKSTSFGQIDPPC